ncbi:gamma carbonic anhydrase family protein [Marinobacterium rhizophilum]|nr:gamma carbonic anhydrase family protein [Marinobacterium rhizophilum]
MTGWLFDLDNMSVQGPDDGEAWVAPGAILVGDVRLARDASIWFGVVMRADDATIEIGEGSNVQDNAVLHVDPGFSLRIGKGCTIGHRAMLHGCTIGDNSLVGMGAMVLNGAKIGRNCLIGAGALVTEGMVIPDNTLVVGSPAKPKREIGPQGEADIRRGAEAYCERWKRYRAELSFTGIAPGIVIGREAP